MRERPIPFSAAMVLAILAGQKTQTRRLVKPQPSGTHRGVYADRYDGGPRWAFWLPDNRMTEPRTWASPYGEPGDRLWVREAWRTGEALEKINATQIAEKALAANYDRPWCPVVYEADGEERNYDPQLPHESGGWGKPGRKRLARFMPRWLSRLTLEVTEARVQRLQDISEEDATAEGVIACDGMLDDADLYRRAKEMGGTATDSRVWFAALWDSINGERAPWQSNPWTWCVSFRRVEVA